MTLDIKRILEGKRRLRRQLAARPIAEKLAMLDVLRDAGRTARVHETQGEHGRSTWKTSEDQHRP